MAFYNYNFNDIDLAIGGLPAKEGLDKEAKVIISRDNPLTEEVEGLGSDDLLVAHLNSKKGTISLTYIYQSPWDLALDHISSVQLPFALGFFHKKANKGLVSTAWVKEQPDLAVGETPDSRTWVIGLANTDFSLLANAEATIGGYKFITDY